MGDTPPPLKGKTTKLFWNSFPERTKNDVFVLIKAKNGPKKPYNRPERTKMYEKSKK